MHFPKNSQHFIDYDCVKADLFTLLNIAYGTHSLRSEYREETIVSRKSYHLMQEFGSHYNSTISNLLIRISITARILDDIIQDQKVGTEASKFQFEPGMAEFSDGFPVHLRECFNKAIHASRITFEEAYEPVVLLSGTKGKMEWNVTLRLLPFCFSAYEWIEESRRAQPGSPYNSSQSLRD